jgi:hypothetical protein
MHQLQQYTRRDGTTVEPEVIELGGHNRKGRQTVVQVTEPVVDPLGNVIAARVDTRLDKPGVRLVVEAHGELILTRHAKELGMVFYRDMCLGRIEGVEASAIHWNIYAEVKRKVAEGWRPPPGYLTPEKLYHPEIGRRRKQARVDGIHRASEDEVEALLEGIRSQGVDDEDAIEAARERGLDLPEAPPAPRDLAAMLNEANG